MGRLAEELLLHGDSDPRRGDRRRQRELLRRVARRVLHLPRQHDRRAAARGLNLDRDVALHLRERQIDPRDPPRRREGDVHEEGVRLVTADQRVELPVEEVLDTADVHHGVRHGHGLAVDRHRVLARPAALLAFGLEDRRRLGRVLHAREVEAGLPVRVENRAVGRADRHLRIAARAIVLGARHHEEIVVRQFPRVGEIGIDVSHPRARELGRRQEEVEKLVGIVRPRRGQMDFHAGRASQLGANSLEDLFCAVLQPVKPVVVEPSRRAARDEDEPARRDRQRRGQGEGDRRIGQAAAQQPVDLPEARRRQEHDRYDHREDTQELAVGGRGREGHTQRGDQDHAMARRSAPSRDGGDDPHEHQRREDEGSVGQRVHAMTDQLGAARTGTSSAGRSPGGTADRKSEALPRAAPGRSSRSGARAAARASFRGGAAVPAETAMRGVRGGRAMRPRGAPSAGSDTARRSRGAEVLSPA